MASPSRLSGKPWADVILDKVRRCKELSETGDQTSLHRLSSFILGYHGCDRKVGERLLEGAAFKPSDNDYDWLGPGIYFWEANPRRALEFATETANRKGTG